MHRQRCRPKSRSSARVCVCLRSPVATCQLHPAAGRLVVAFAARCRYSECGCARVLSATRRRTLIQTLSTPVLVHTTVVAAKLLGEPFVSRQHVSGGNSGRSSGTLHKFHGTETHTEPTALVLAEHTVCTTQNQTSGSGTCMQLKLLSSCPPDLQFRDDKCSTGLFSPTSGFPGHVSTGRHGWWC